MRFLTVDLSCRLYLVSVSLATLSVHLELSLSVCFFFFFQAEDGIRDKLVTGVQTCALPISRARRIMSAGSQGPDATQRYRTCQTRALTSRGVRITVSPLPEWAVRAVPRTPEVHHAVLASLLHPVARRVSPRILRNVSSAAGAAATAFVATGSAASAGRLAAGPARPAAGALAG